mmetsp:Transcript_14252/g.57990  ORF Transcript_14252/g.57990 Transcript_14252/m.57990 type:complete len:98 (-) Transcript_14252:836-1129(-)
MQINNNIIFLRARCLAAPLRWKCSALDLLCAMHSRLYADPAALLTNPSTQARIKMTRARAVGFGGSTTSLIKAAAVLAGNVFRCVSQLACELVLHWP